MKTIIIIYASSLSFYKVCSDLWRIFENSKIGLTCPFCAGHNSFKGSNPKSLSVHAGTMHRDDELYDNICGIWQDMKDLRHHWNDQAEFEKDLIRLAQDRGWHKYS